MRRDLIIIGRVISPHAVKGEIRIDYYNPGLHFFSGYECIFLQSPGEGQLRRYKILGAKPHKGVIIARLEGVNSRDDAEELRGWYVVVERRELPPTDEDEYYWHEIVGMEVATEEGLSLGIVRSIFSTGSNDVYVVRGDGKEILIPAITQVIVNVDHGERRIVIRPMKGLLEDRDL